MTGMDAPQGQIPSDPPATPSGWYDDGSGRQRWWDGLAWTEHRAPTKSARTTSRKGLPRPLLIVSIVFALFVLGGVARAATGLTQSNAGSSTNTSTTPAIESPADVTYAFTQESAIDPDTPVAPTEAAAVVALDWTVTKSTAVELLATLPVKNSEPNAGYARSAMFGEAWLDVNRNGCDTRNDILARDLIAAAKRGSCTVTAGNLRSPYTSTEIAFVRGNDTSALVQIDHVVSLTNAWRTGAQHLTQAQRISLANDPLNLLAVDGQSNAQKGGGDAAAWLPNDRSFACPYVARQISVKATYGLWVTQAEHDAMSRVLQSCAGETALTSPFAPAPAPPPAPVAAPEPVAAPAREPVPLAEPAPAQAPAPSVYYENCTAVRAAGAAPIMSGDPGFQPKFDRDNDGIGCE